MGVGQNTPFYYYSSAARDFLLDVRGVAGPPARGEGLRSFPGGATQQTVASVDHRETPQQFDKMATADLYRDLLIPITGSR